MDTAIVKDGEITKAVLISLNCDETPNSEASLDELEKLLETCGGIAAARVVQSRNSPDPATYIGSGKAKEISDYLYHNRDVNLAIVDNELSPSQLRNLEDIFGVRVIDRTMLILDIFALHAKSAAGRLQVEIACLRYTAPRLTGRGKELSRLGGGIGTRGPGESKLETDRRHIRRRIEALEEKIVELESTLSVQREARKRRDMMTAAIVGYTNAGKSTLLNFLTGEHVLAENKLFATLDVTTRALTLPDGNKIFLADTVGFIDRLPHHLIKAFKSTLDELKNADIVIMLHDVSETPDERTRKSAVTHKLLAELGSEEATVIEVFNKTDICPPDPFVPKDAICISSVTGEGMELLTKKLEEAVANGKRVYELFFPFSEMARASALHNDATILSEEYTEDGAYITAKCDSKTAGAYKHNIMNKKDV